jgi:hypothetical protein
VITFPDFDGTAYLNGKTLSITDIYSSSPTCLINECTFAGRHELSLGTSVFYQNEPTDKSELMYIGSSSMQLIFQLAEIGEGGKRMQKDEILTETESSSDEEENEYISKKKSNKVGISKYKLNNI